MQIPENMIGEVIPLISNIFGNISNEEIDSILQLLEWVPLKSGAFLFRKGAIGDNLVLVVHGKLKVLLNEGEETLEIRELFRGAVIGEMAVISETTRNADVLATRDCNLVSISKAGFEKLYAAHPKLGLHISKLIIHRLKPDPLSRKTRLIKNVVLFVGNDGNDIQAFLYQLKSHCPEKQIYILDQQESLLHYYGLKDSNPSHSKLISLSNALEKEFDLVFYIVDNQYNDWAEFCFRQADEILCLCSAEGSTSVRPAESKLFAARQLLDASFILFYNKSIDLPENTRAFLKNRNPKNVFHIRDKNDKDFRRLVRHLFQKTRGLVLAGGGAGAMAHLGVWKAIKELGIELDMIGGTSMGALVGGGMGFDFDFKTLYEICKELTNSRPSRDINPIPYVSVIRGGNLNRLLKKHYKDYDVLDCWIPFFCISADLTAFKSSAHFKGNMYRAIRASGSIPAVVPPVPIDGHWHVDGGIYDNFPVEEMIQKGIQKIIGVSFLTGEPKLTKHVNVPSVTQQIKHGLFNTVPELKIPSLIENVMLSTTANSYQKQISAQAKTDWIINPDVSKYGLLEWKCFENVVEIGYQEAMKVLSNIEAQ